MTIFSKKLGAWPLCPPWIRLCSHCLAASPAKYVWGQQSHAEIRSIATWSEPLRFVAMLLLRNKGQQ